MLDGRRGTIFGVCLKYVFYKLWFCASIHAIMLLLSTSLAEGYAGQSRQLSLSTRILTYKLFVISAMQLCL